MAKAKPRRKRAVKDPGGKRAAPKAKKRAAQSRAAGGGGAKATAAERKPSAPRRSAPSPPPPAVDAVARALEGWRPQKGTHEIHRWTIDRLDKQADVVRIEQVRMKAAKAAQMASSDLDEARRNEVDELSWWDTRHARLALMTPGELRDLLGLEPDAALAENMVFWLLLQRDLGGTPRVFHATRAARQLAKRLYEAVTDVQPG